MSDFKVHYLLITSQSTCFFHCNLPLKFPGIWKLGKPKNILTMMFFLMISSKKTYHKTDMAKKNANAFHCFWKSSVVYNNWWGAFETVELNKSHFSLCGLEVHLKYNWNCIILIFNGWVASYTRSWTYSNNISIYGGIL